MQAPDSQPTPLARRLISIGIVLHFLVIALCYSGNWARSTAKEQAIQFCYPYLVGMNWYLEVFPVEWARSGDNEEDVRILATRDSGESIELLSTFSAKSDRQREQQLARFISTVSGGGEDDGLSLLLLPLVRYEESTQSSRFVKLEIDRRSGEQSDFETIYQARIVRDNAGISFVPLLESTRTVESLLEPSSGSSSEGAK
jgi:hypothetical protein